MSRPPRGLSTDEAALWAQLAATVTPLRPPPKVAAPVVVPAPVKAPVAQPKRLKGRVPPPLVTHRPAPPTLAPPTLAPSPPAKTLDSHWERRLARASTAPDFTLDLHGHTLDQAYRRLDSGLVQAKAMGARVVLVITGKARPVDAADRGTARGAIRAKILDWLAAGPHGSDVAAVKQAHRRHGGDGALYLVLKKRR